MKFAPRITVRRLLVALAMGLGASCAAAAEVPPGRSHALVIGNNAYRHLPELKTAVNDASVVADLLRTKYGFEVELLLNASRYRIVSALNRMRRKLTPRDSLLIYYAGHGILDEASDTGYWLPVDAERDNEANWIANSTVSRNLRAMTALHVMVVADSCYSGALVRSVDAKLRTGAEREAWLERMQSKRSRTALVSGGLEPVADSGGHGHSVFARQFIEALRSNDEVLDGQGLYDRIKRPVVVKAEQTPRYSDIRGADHDGGDFLFEPLTARATAEAGKTSGDGSGAARKFDARQLELAFWTAIEDSTNPADFKEYLERFPDGTFAGLAGRHLKRLAEAGGAASRATPGTAVALASRTPPPAAGHKTFRDCEACPEMVVVPPGSFIMGSRRGEFGEGGDEGPQYRVTITRPFAAGRFEVTFAQWDACVADGGCDGRSPDDEGWGRGDRPVINVSWEDAKHYVSWLSRKTGQRYRLLTEAEWEYAARAGTTTPYWWGDRASHQHANYADDSCCDGRDDSEFTASVGRFPANAFGLHDILGNVYEWVEDCGHASYEGAPNDGSAWIIGGNCDTRIIRGGSWASNVEDLRSAHRNWDDPDNSGAATGFRVARELAG